MAKRLLVLACFAMGIVFCVSALWLLENSDRLSSRGQVDETLERRITTCRTLAGIVGLPGVVLTGIGAVHLWLPTRNQILFRRTPPGG